MLLRLFSYPTLLAALLPLASHAQAPAAGPRFYAGLSAALLTDSPFTSGSTTNMVGPALTAGVQLSPRWALQASATIARKRESSTVTYPATTSTPAILYTYDERNLLFTVPVLARYTFAPLAGRFHAEALGGITLLHSSRRYIYDATPTGQATTTSESSSGYTNGSLSLGPALRYALSPQVAITADVPLNFVLLAPSSSHFRDRLFLNILVGACYTFGRG